MNENTPIPDPSTLTTQQLDKSIERAIEYIDGQVQALHTRLDGMDARQGDDRA